MSTAAAVALGALLLALALFGLRGELGYRLARPAGAALGWFVGDVLRVRRSHASAAVALAELPAETASAMYAQLGRGLFELVWLSLPGKRELGARVTLSEDLLPWLSSERGVVVATAHTGNWDLAACAVAQQRELVVVTKHFKRGALDRLWQGLRRRYGVELVSAGQVLRVASKALPQGKAVAMMIDQAPERTRSTLLHPFLGQTAEVDLAPALVALRLKVPLIGVFPRRLPDGRHRLELACSFLPPPNARRAWAEECMAELTERLEAHVRKAPADWLWMHRRWKRTAVPARPAGDTSVGATSECRAGGFAEAAQNPSHATERAT